MTGGPFPGRELSSFGKVENLSASPHGLSPLDDSENMAIIEEVPGTASESISILYASSVKLREALDTVTRDPEVKPERAKKAMELWQRNVEAYDRAVSARGEKADLQAALTHGFEQARQIYAARWFMRPSTKTNKRDILVALRDALNQQHPPRLSDQRPRDTSENHISLRNTLYNHARNYIVSGGAGLPERSPGRDQALLEQAGNIWIEILGERMMDPQLTSEETVWVNRIQSHPEETGDVVREILKATYDLVAQRVVQRYEGHHLRVHNTKDNTLVHVAALFKRADSLVRDTPVLWEKSVMSHLSQVTRSVITDSPEPTE